MLGFFSGSARVLGDGNISSLPVLLVGRSRGWRMNVWLHDLCKKFNVGLMLVFVHADNVGQTTA